MSCPIDNHKDNESTHQDDNLRTEKGCASNRINDKNLMQQNESQKQWPGQKMSLDTERVVSNIPNANEEGEMWIYPSEQQFFNAMKRKGWRQTQEKDMNSVVKIHNHVNDVVWLKILEYEKQHCEECPTPKLSKFLGRPDELSPKAFFKSTFMGYKKPFDRHDWVVDRCGQKVRYVIDFYKGEMNAKQKEIGQVGFYVDVRPALDSFSSAVDRIRHIFNKI